MTKPAKLKATITFQDDDKFVQLLSAFYAVHDPFSHDNDGFTLIRDDGSMLLDPRCNQLCGMEKEWAGGRRLDREHGFGSEEKAADMVSTRPG